MLIVVSRGSGRPTVAGHNTTAVRLVGRAPIFFMLAVGAVIEMPKSKTPRFPPDPLAGVDTNRPFPRLRLSTAQWSKISKLSGIPNSDNDAHKSIEIALGMFRQFQAADLRLMSAAEIRKEFRALAEDARKLCERLSALVSSPDAYTALTGDVSRFSSLDRLSDIAERQASVSSTKSQWLMKAGRQRLSKIYDVLLGAPKWFLIAAYRVKHEKRGPKGQNVYWLVGNLDGIREQFTGKLITRSYKDDGSVDIKYVCKIADPSIGRGTIDRAMRHRISHRTVD